MAGSTSLFGCESSDLEIQKSDNLTSVSFHWHHIKETQQLDGIAVAGSAVMGRANELILKNDLLIVADVDPNALIWVIDPNETKPAYSLGVKGLGPGEILTASTLDKGLDKNSFWSYSKNHKMWSEFELNSKSRLAKNQKKLEGSLFSASSPLWTSRSTIISRDLNGESILKEFNTEGDLLASYGDWDATYARTVPERIKASIFQGKLKANEAHNEFVLASVIQDNLEILMLDNTAMVSIKGPDQMTPEFSIGNVANAPVHIPDERKTAYAYLDVFITSKSYYGLYSGSNEDFVQGKFASDQIIVIDKETFQPSLIKLDRLITHFTIDEKKQILFAVSYEANPKIISYAL